MSILTATKQAAMRKFCREHDAGDVTEYGKGCVTRRPSFASDSVLHPERGVMGWWGLWFDGGRNNEVGR